MASDSSSRYVPAAGHRALTGAYDRIMALTMRESRWRPTLQAAVLEGLPEAGVVVDIGSGTGTLAIALAGTRPDARVVAIDGDDDIGRLARAKSGAEKVVWRAGLADDLPVDDASADRVVMSLLLHHLDLAGKSRALAEVRRVLRPGGRLHIADWGRPADPLMRAAFFGLQLVDGFDGTRDHAAGRLPHLVASAGFSDVQPGLRLRTYFGQLELLSASPGTG